MVDVHLYSNCHGFCPAGTRPCDGLQRSVGSITLKKYLSYKIQNTFLKSSLIQLLLPITLAIKAKIQSTFSESIEIQITL